MFSLSTVLSLLVMAAMALVVAAIAVWRRGGRRNAVLMVVLALVAALNVAIWTVPDSKGDSPMSRADQIEQAE